MLISLSILGVIAALTLPGVITHMTWASNKAKLKATVSAVHQALYSATLDGSYTDVKDVLLAKLNYATHCPPNNVDGPCAKAWWAPAGGAYTYAHRFIMPDGSIIWDHGDGRVHIKVEYKTYSTAADGTGNAMDIKYNPTMVTQPDGAHYPAIPPGAIRPYKDGVGWSSTSIYKKVFE